MICKICGYHYTRRTKQCLVCGSVIDWTEEEKQKKAEHKTGETGTAGRRTAENKTMERKTSESKNTEGKTTENKTAENKIPKSKTSREKMNESRTPNNTVPEHTEAVGIYIGKSVITVYQYTDTGSQELISISNFVTVSGKGEVLYGDRATLYRWSHEDIPKYSVLDLAENGGWSDTSMVFYHGIGYRSSDFFKDIFSILYNKVLELTSADSVNCIVSITDLTFRKLLALRRWLSFAGFNVLRLYDSSAMCAWYEVYIQKRTFEKRTYLAIEEDWASLSVMDLSEDILEVTEPFRISGEQALRLWDQHQKEWGIFLTPLAEAVFPDEYLAREYSDLSSSAAIAAAAYAAKLSGFPVFEGNILLEATREDYGIEFYTKNEVPKKNPEWVFHRDTSIPIERGVEFPTPGDTTEQYARLYIGDSKQISSCLTLDVGLKVILQLFSNPSELECSFIIQSDAAILLSFKDSKTGDKKSLRILGKSPKKEPAADRSDRTLEEIRKELISSEIFYRQSMSRLSESVLQTACGKGVLQIYKKYTNLLESWNQSDTMTREKMIRDSLSILDDIELALKNSSIQNEPEIQVMLSSVCKYMHRSVIQPLGLVPVEADGKSFDACIHEAISFEECSKLSGSVVIEEIQSGYYLDRKLLRPAKVRVAK